MIDKFLPSETNIFISYRRLGGLEHARIIYLDLIRHGYTNIFFDYESLRDGAFDSQIETAIRACNDFLVILSPLSMDRCYLSDDWVAQEIRYALKYSKPIIPVCINTSGFNWPLNFPSDLKRICTIQRHCLLTNEYFADSMRKLAHGRLQSRPIGIKKGTVKISFEAESAPMPEIRLKLKEWGGCRLASITDYGKAVIVKGGNTVFYTDKIPNGMKKVLDQLSEANNVYIAEVCVTEYYWFVIYKDNAWHGKGYVPERFKKDLNYLFAKNSFIKSITMNDAGEYIVVANTDTIITRYKDQELVRSVQNGRLLSAQVTNDGVLLCFERGILGESIPEEINAKLSEVFKEKNLGYDVIKFTDAGLFLFANNDSFSCYM